LGLNWPGLIYGSVPQLEFSGALGLRRAPLGASREMAKNSISNLMQKERGQVSQLAQTSY